MSLSLDNFRLVGRVFLGTDEEAAKATGQYEAAQAVLLRLYHRNQPGCIVGDEVGLGKTYVALGVAAWRLATKPKSRVLILTSSRHMAEQWIQRWATVKPSPGSHALAKWPTNCIHARSWEDLLNACDGKASVVVASYDALRSRETDRERFRWRLAEQIIRHGSPNRIQATTIKRLIKELGIDLRCSSGEALTVSRRLARTFWKENVEQAGLRWLPGARGRFDVTAAEHRATLLKTRFDLVIVDEAHRLRAPGRETTLLPVLARCARRILYLTATPFSLAIKEFATLLDHLTIAAGSDRDYWQQEVAEIGLEEYRQRLCDGSKTSQSWLAEFTARLRRWIVRRTWEDIKTTSRLDHMPREVLPQTWEIDREQLKDGDDSHYAAIALERAIAAVLASSSQTHIASRRTSLCSSWPAASRSLADSPLSGSDPWIQRLSRTTLNLLSDKPGPKITDLADRITKEVRQGHKLVVFAERTETLLALGKALRQRLADIVSVDNRLRNAAWARLRRHVEQPAWWQRLQAASLASLIARGLKPEAAKRAWMKWKQRVIPSNAIPPWLNQNHRVLPAVAILDQAHGDVDALCSAFQTPIRPWVLLCGRKAQESIDLHRDCSTVVLADPVWSPADREQRIGRVRRIGAPPKNIRCIDVYTRGTYEEQIIGRCRERAQLMRALLGAQDILIASKESGCDADSLVERMRIDLAPKRTVKIELDSLIEPGLDA